MLKKCIYGGGDSCVRQGGDGSLDHGSSYAHPFTTTVELGLPVEVFVEKSLYMTEQNHEIALSVDFDETLAEGILSLEISKGIDVAELVKSLYEFDIESEEGITQLLELLPIMDPTIVVELVEKLWPGYAVESADPDLLRAEVKGFLLDYVDGRFQEPIELEPTDLDGAEAPPEEGADDEDEAGLDGDESGDDEAADEEASPDQEEESPE